MVVAATGRDSRPSIFFLPLNRLYPSCPWDVRTARRLIIEKRIAPRFPGRETKESCFTHECPICFMFYPSSLNTATCCKKPICTECYLQLKPPKKAVWCEGSAGCLWDDWWSHEDVSLFLYFYSCPYCNREAFGVKYTAPAVLNISSAYTDNVRILWPRGIRMITHR
jgi:hypothetical protein